MKHLKRSFLILIVFSVLTGLVYPLIITGISQLVFPHQANGSLIVINGQIVGSELIGQSFTKPEYFHSRPSAINYDAGNSGGTNLGPTNQKLISQIDSTARVFRTENGLHADASIPADMVTSSASGLDPNISLASALIQVSRVANARGVNETVVRDLVDRYTEKPLFGIFGQPMVNVLKLNIALDENMTLPQRH
ncbi:MAG: potassium-transporting ATPase subunit KdpC [bacterium]